MPKQVEFTPSTELSCAYITVKFKYLMTSTGIIGGGITGLTKAFRLLQQGVDVTVWESGPRAGGALQSFRVGDWLAEGGPNSIQDSDAAVGELVAALNLESRLLEASTEAKRRYIVRNKKPVLVPNSAVSAVTTSLFSWKAKFGILGEPFRPVSSTPDETLASFVRRRLGQEFLDYAINPMVGGIFAGDPEQLSVSHAFGKVKALEDEFGSLIKGAIGRARQRRRDSHPPHKKRVLSFPDGLSELTDALVSALGDRVKTGHPVTRVRACPAGGYWVTVDPAAAEVHVDQLVFAGTLPSLAHIQFDKLSALPDPVLSAMTYAPAVSVTTGFHREQVAHPLDGFGVLVPEVEGMNILGTLFTSSIFPQRAPSDGVTLTTFVGGMRSPALTECSDEELLALVLSDLDTLLDVHGKPEFVHITRWPKAIPQYELGFETLLERMKTIESANLGFSFAGNYRTGISLDACIRNAWNRTP